MFQSLLLNRWIEGFSNHTWPQGGLEHVGGELHLQSQGESSSILGVGVTALRPALLL